MKNALFIFTLSVVFLFVSVAAFADSQQEILQQIESDMEAIDDFFSATEVAQDDPDAFSQLLLLNIPALFQHLNESTTFYESKISTETDEQLKTILTNINTDIEGLLSSLLSVEESVKIDDDDAYERAAEQFDSHLVLFDSHISALEEYFGLGDYSWLAWLFLLSLIISAVLFILSRGNPLLPAEQVRNKFEFALFKSSLWPLAGSAISYFWYLFTPPGETFYILYGPIAVGYFQFFRGLFVYFIRTRPAINRQEKEEKEKLESLITSERFQKEGVAEKVGSGMAPPPVPDAQARGYNAAYGEAVKALDNIVVLQERGQRKLDDSGKHSAERAIEHFTRALAIVPTAWQAMWGIGKAHRALGDHSQALEWFEKAYTIEQKNPDVAREASLEAMALGIKDKAVQYATAAFDRDPKNPGFIANVALALLLDGDRYNSLYMAEKACALNPDDVANKNVLAFVKEVLDGKRPWPEKIEPQ